MGRHLSTQILAGPMARTMQLIDFANAEFGPGPSIAKVTIYLTHLPNHQLRNALTICTGGLR